MEYELTKEYDPFQPIIFDIDEDWQIDSEPMTDEDWERWLKNDW